MRILHLIYDHIRNPWVGGGGAIRAYEIYRRLATRHQITIVCGKYPGAKDYEEANVKIHFVGTGIHNYLLSTFYYAFFANSFLRKHYRDYDAVIEDFAPWNPLFGFKFNFNKCVILQIQNFLGKEILKKYNIIGIPFYLMEKYYPLKFKNIIVVNNILATRYRLSRSRTLSNGIDEDFLRTDVSADGDYIGYMGRIDIYQKGLDILENAMQTVPVKLKVAGDGRDRKRFLEMLKDRSNIGWVGLVKGTQKIEFLSKLSFLVVPSRYEGQGIVVLEAAACGKPVIVSDIPELRYAVEAGFGVSFRIGDPADLAEKIKILLNNPVLRREMGKNAKEYAKGFTWDKIAEKYENYLEEVVERHNRTNWR